MNKSPAFQFYPDKFLAGTIHLSANAFRAYTRVLCWMWLNGRQQCDILEDKRLVCGAAGISLKSYDKVWLQEIMSEHNPLLQREGKYLVSNGLRKEVIKQNERRKKATESANARWAHSERNANASNEHTPKQCSLTPSPSPASSTDKEKGVNLPDFGNGDNPDMLSPSNLTDLYITKAVGATGYSTAKQKITAALARGVDAKTIRQAIIEGGAGLEIWDVLSKFEQKPKPTLTRNALSANTQPRKPDEGAHVFHV